jgi:hypothetical protein
MSMLSGLLVPSPNSVPRPSQWAVRAVMTIGSRRSAANARAVIWAPTVSRATGSKLARGDSRRSFTAQLASTVGPRYTQPTGLRRLLA